MKELKLIRKILTIISFIMIVVSIISIILIQACPQLLGYDNIARGAWFLIFAFAFVMALVILVIVVFFHCVMHYTNKPMRPLKKIAKIIAPIIPALFLICVIDQLITGIFGVREVYFWTFIVCVGVLLYIGLVSLTVFIVRKIKGIIV